MSHVDGAQGHLIRARVTVVSLRGCSSVVFFFLMIRRPPRSTPFPTRRSSDLTTQQRNGPMELYDQIQEAKQAIGKRWSRQPDRKSTRLNSSHLAISYAVF